MSTVERQPEDRRSFRERVGNIAEFERNRRLDKAVADLPDFGINLSREEVGHWLDFAEKLKDLMFKMNPHVEKFGARLWDEGWVLLVAHLYRQAPDWDVESGDMGRGAPYIGHQNPGPPQRTLSRAYDWAVGVMMSTSFRTGERLELNLDEAFPALESCVRDQEDDEKRFDEDAQYELDGEGHEILRDMLSTLSETMSVLQEQSWRSDVTSMCAQLDRELTPPGKALENSQASDTGDNRLVPGFLLNYLDHIFSFKQGYFSYLMHLLALMRANSVDVESLTGNLVGGFVTVNEMLDDYAAAFGEEAEDQE